MIWQENRLVSKYIMRRDDPRNGFIEYADSVPSRFKDVLRSGRRLEPSELLAFVAVNPRALCLLEEVDLKVLHMIFPLSNDKLHCCIDQLFLFERTFMAPPAFPMNEYLRCSGQMYELGRFAQNSINPEITKAVIQQRLHAELMSAWGEYCDAKQLAEEAVSSPSDVRFSLVPGILGLRRICGEVSIYDRKKQQITVFPGLWYLIQGGDLAAFKLFKDSAGNVWMRGSNGKKKDFQVPEYCNYYRRLQPKDDGVLLSGDAIATALATLGYHSVDIGDLKEQGYRCYLREASNPEFWECVKESYSKYEEAQQSPNRFQVECQHSLVLERLTEKLEKREVFIASVLVFDPNDCIVFEWIDYRAPDRFHLPLKVYTSTATPTIYPVTANFDVIRFGGAWHIRCLDQSNSSYELSRPKTGDGLSHYVTVIYPITAPTLTDEVLTDPTVHIGSELVLNLSDSSAVARRAISSIKTFNGRSINCIERDMRPGAACSSLGLLPFSDSLLNAIAEHFLAFQQSQVTPRLVAAILRAFQDSPFLVYVIGAWYRGDHIFFIHHCAGWHCNYGNVLNPFKDSLDPVPTREYTYLKYLLAEKRSGLDDHKKTGQLIISFTGIHLELLKYCFLQKGPYEFKIGELMYAITQAMNSPFTETAASATPPSQSHKIPAAGQSDVTSAAENTAAAAIPIAMAGNSQSLYRMPSGGDASAGENPQNICGKK